MTDYFLHGVEVIEIDNGPRPIRTIRSSVIGLIGAAPDADEKSFPLNMPVLIAGSRGQAAKLGASGTLPAAIDGIFDQAGALVVVIRVAAGATPAETQTNILGGVDKTTGQYQGLHAFLAAQPVVKVTPRILITPGFIHQRPVDPDDKTSPSPDPKSTVPKPPASPPRQLANPVVAELLGIAERLRAVIIADGPNTNDIAAIDYRKDWGSPRLYVVDPHVKLMKNGAVATEPASARISGPWIATSPGLASREVSEGVNAYLRHLKAQGAILGGRCWADPDLNSPQSIQDGKIYFNFDFTPPYPAERIIFRSHLVDDYLEEILQWRLNCRAFSRT